MGGITKNIGRSSKEQTIGPDHQNEIKRVLICRPNHRLGNQLLLTPLVQEISETFPNCKIDLFVKGNLAPILFKNYEKIDRIIRLPKEHFKQPHLYIWSWLKLKNRKYDFVVNVDKNSSSGKLSTKFARGTYKIFGDGNEELPTKHKDYTHLAKYPIYNLRNCLGKTEEVKKELPVMDLKLTSSEIEKGKKILQNLVANEQKTISLYTYATGNKRCSETWWMKFYEKLQKEFPEHNIIEILPKENVSQIDFKAIHFYSQDIREITSVIANTDIFIGTDSGMMHLASASKTPTLGLFSVTKMDKYQPYGNHSRGIHIEETDQNEMIEIVKKVLAGI